MPKHDKYTVEIRSPNGYAVCCDGQIVRLVSQAFRNQPLEFADLSVAEDFCFMMNHAFKKRMEQEIETRAADRKGCDHRWKWSHATNRYECEECEGSARVILTDETGQPPPPSPEQNEFDEDGDITIGP